LNFRNLLNKISYYFRDSYGLDKLSKYLLFAGIILSAGRYTIIFSYALLIYGSWRAISKNKYKRHQELAVFENFLLLLNQKFYRFKASLKGFRQYKIFKCPSCSQKLRIPRKKGKITITCKKCGTEFKGKS
jgi:hypothetical protein